MDGVVNARRAGPWDRARLLGEAQGTRIMPGEMICTAGFAAGLALAAVMDLYLGVVIVSR